MGQLTGMHFFWRTHTPGSQRSDFKQIPVYKNYAIRLTGI